MSRIIFMLAVLTFAHGILMTPISPAKTTSYKNETVVLLHGLARTQRSLSDLGDRLNRHGFNVINIDYPSRKHSVEKLATLVSKHLEMKSAKLGPRVNFVTHSLGGILVRWLVKQKQIDNIGRVVMLAPPNKGSEIVDLLKRFSLVRHVMGPAFDQIGTDRRNLPSALGPVDFELGVIAGEKSFNPIFSYLLPGTDDGKVSIESAKVEGMQDFLVVPNSHGFIMQSSTVGEQVVFFLKYGRFNHGGSP